MHTIAFIMPTGLFAKAFSIIISSGFSYLPAYPSRKPLPPRELFACYTFGMLIYHRLKPHKASVCPLATFSVCSPAICVCVCVLQSMYCTCMNLPNIAFKADFFPKVLINTHFWSIMILFLAYFSTGMRNEIFK